MADELKAFDGNSEGQCAPSFLEVDQLDDCSMIFLCGFRAVIAYEVG